MLSIREVVEFLESEEDIGAELVGIDEGGLSLVTCRGDGEPTEGYLEVGGVPVDELDED